MSAERVKKWRAKTKDILVKAMGGHCVICGYNKCNASLAFHHLDPSQKDFSFGKIRANPKSIDKIIIEIKKCIMVCHNCHSEIHSGVTLIPINVKSFDEKIYKELISKPQNFCPICGKEIYFGNKTCSLSCSRKIRCKIDWSKIDIQNNKSNCQLAKELGVSETVIRKRRKKIKSFEI